MMEETAALRHKRMTEGDLGALMVRISLPSAVAMLVTALYSLADSFFVSKLGTEAGAAVGISFAIQATIQAVSYTLGVGAGSLLSRKLGEKDTAGASCYARAALILSIGSGLLIAAVGLSMGGKLITLLGAGESIYPFALAYARNVLLSAPFMCTSFVLSQLLRAEGRAVWSMIGLLCGSVLNMILDPILITTYGMGIAGASMATLISQIVCFIILAAAYVFRKSQIALFRDWKLRDLTQSGKILLSGLPSSGRQGLMAVSTILLNHATADWGDAAVAAMSVVSRLFLLAFSLCLGIGQGMMPVTGYNFGYRRYDRVRSAYRLAVISSTILMLAVEIPFLIYAPRLIAFFRDDPAVVAIGARALRAQSLVFVLHGCITCTNMLLQSIGSSTGATVLACARQGIFFLPLFWLLPLWFGLESVIYVQPLSDALTFLFTVPFVVYVLRKTLKIAKE